MKGSCVDASVVTFSRAGGQGMPSPVTPREAGHVYGRANETPIYARMTPDVANDGRGALLILGRQVRHGQDGTALHREAGYPESGSYYHSHHYHHHCCCWNHMFQLTEPDMTAGQLNRTEKCLPGGEAAQADRPGCREVTQGATSCSRATRSEGLPRTFRAGQPFGSERFGRRQG